LSTAPHNVVRWRGVVILIAVFIVAAAIGQATVGRAALRKVGLVKVPTGFTSLAFRSPQSLPVQLSSAQKALAVSFVIRNAGSAARDYRWSVHLAQGAHTRRVDGGEVRVRPGREAPISRLAKFPCVHGPRIRIIVNLAHPNEAIGAWVVCRSSKRKPR
jgi:hypothetical protein